MQIDVIIATYNRAEMLKRAIRSILRSELNRKVDFLITVIDNNSSDDTAQSIARLAEEEKGYVNYLFEPRQGKSYAVNKGIAATHGEIVAFADDDQIMGEGWLAAIHAAIEDGYDYVNGRTFGEWEIRQPEWYSDSLRGVLSLYDGGNERVSHIVNDESSDGFPGNNGAVKRAALEKVGGYHIALGKMTGSFAMCEDSELLIRLKREGFRGLYEPRMEVFHHIPRERLTKRYFRDWHFGYGISMAMVDTLHPKNCSYWIGIPLYLIRRTLESFPRMIGAALRVESPAGFEQELNLWFMAGFITGKFKNRSPETAPQLSQSKV